MTLANIAFHEHPTEAVAMLLMAEERGADLSKVPTALGISHKRMVDLMKQGRDGELERIAPAGGAGGASTQSTRYAFAPDSKTALIAVALARFGFMSAEDMRGHAKAIGTNFAEIRHRLRVGLERAGMDVDQMTDGGLTVPEEQRASLRAIAANSWFIGSQS